MSVLSAVRCGPASELCGPDALYTFGRGVFALIFLLFFFCSGFVLRLAVDIFVFKCHSIHVC